MGETHDQPFQLSFNASLQVDFQGSRVTSDGGLILVRELDERVGFGELIEQHLTDSRRGKNTQFLLADLLRQSVYGRLAGYEDLNDARRLSLDPTFRLISSEKVWDRGAALTSRLQTFETEMLAEEENFAELARLNRALIGRAGAMDSGHRTVLDMDSAEIPVYGEQEQSAYNGHFESTCYHPLLLFNREGDCLAAKLRPGNVHSAEGWLSVIAYSLGNLWRRLALPSRIDNWSLTSLQQRLVKTGGRLVKHALCRYRHKAWNADLRIMPIHLTLAYRAAALTTSRSA
jgi:Transposase DDE domain group 1